MTLLKKFNRHKTIFPNSLQIFSGIAITVTGTWRWTSGGQVVDSNGKVAFSVTTHTAGSTALGKDWRGKPKGDCRKIHTLQNWHYNGQVHDWSLCISGSSSDWSCEIEVQSRGHYSNNIEDMIARHTRHCEEMENMFQVSHKMAFANILLMVFLEVSLKTCLRLFNRFSSFSFMDYIT